MTMNLRLSGDIFKGLAFPLDTKEVARFAHVVVVLVTLVPWKSDNIWNSGRL